MKKKTLEALALEIMAECERDGEPVTKEEALEMAKMEANEKESRRYEKSDTPRKETTRTRKVDKEKAFLLNLLYNGAFEADGIVIGNKKNETEFSFTYGENSYTVKLIKHRPPKS